MKQVLIGDRSMKEIATRHRNLASECLESSRHIFRNRSAQKSNFSGSTFA